MLRQREQEFFHHPRMHPLLEAAGATFGYGPYLGGKSFHGAPVRRIHKNTIDNFAAITPGTPAAIVPHSILWQDGFNYFPLLFS